MNYYGTDVPIDGAIAHLDVHTSAGIAHTHTVADMLWAVCGLELWMLLLAIGIASDLTLNYY